jgi:hypothetical protein
MSVDDFVNKVKEEIASKALPAAAPAATPI